MSTFEVGDVFWGKSLSYPWWPCIIVPNKQNGTERNIKKLGFQYYVQLIGPEYDVCWISESFLVKYLGREQFECYLKEQLNNNLSVQEKLKFDMRMSNTVQIMWTQSCDEADKLLKMNVHDRLSLLPKCPVVNHRVKRCSSLASVEDTTATIEPKENTCEDVSKRPKRSYSKSVYVEPESDVDLIYNEVSLEPHGKSKRQRRSYDKAANNDPPEAEVKMKKARKSKTSEQVVHVEARAKKEKQPSDSDLYKNIDSVIKDVIGSPSVKERKSRKSHASDNGVKETVVVEKKRRGRKPNKMNGPLGKGQAEILQGTNGSLGLKAETLPAMKTVTNENLKVEENTLVSARLVTPEEPLLAPINTIVVPVDAVATECSEVHLSQEIDSGKTNEPTEECVEGEMRSQCAVVDPILEQITLEMTAPNNDSQYCQQSEIIDPVVETPVVETLEADHETNFDLQSSPPQDNTVENGTDESHPIKEIDEAPVAPITPETVSSHGDHESSLATPESTDTIELGDGLPAQPVSMEVTAPCGIADNGDLIPSPCLEDE